MMIMMLVVMVMIIMMTRRGSNCSEDVSLSLSTRNIETAKTIKYETQRRRSLWTDRQLECMTLSGGPPRRARTRAREGLRRTASYTRQLSVEPRCEYIEMLLHYIRVQIPSPEKATNLCMISRKHQIGNRPCLTFP